MSASDPLRTFAEVWMLSTGSGSWRGALSGRDAVQRQSETKDAVGRDRSTRAIAVSERWRDPDDPFIARPHQLQGLGEAGNEAVDRSGQRRTTLKLLSNVSPVTSLPS
jgi:hypothetical protein